jgi:hypothetical protein
MEAMTGAEPAAAAGLGGASLMGAAGPEFERILLSLAEAMQAGQLDDGPALTEAFVTQMLQERLSGAPAETIAARASEMAGVLNLDPEFQRRLARLVRSNAAVD